MCYWSAASRAQPPSQKAALEDPAHDESGIDWPEPSRSQEKVQSPERTAESTDDKHRAAGPDPPAPASGRVAPGSAALPLEPLLPIPACKCEPRTTTEPLYRLPKAKPAPPSKHWNRGRDGVGLKSSTGAASPRVPRCLRSRASHAVTFLVEIASHLGKSIEERLGRRAWSRKGLPDLVAQRLKSILLGNEEQTRRRSAKPRTAIRFPNQGLPGTAWELSTGPFHRFGLSPDIRERAYAKPSASLR